MNIPALIAAILLPPLGTFLVKGARRDFVIAVVLTLLFFLPGLILSVFIVCGGSTDRPAAAIARRWQAMRLSSSRT